jgi:hypothetical protein
MRNADYEVLVFFLLLIAVLFAASGCGRGLASPSAPHGTFSPYFQAFEDASEQNGRSTYGDDSVRIVFGATTGEVVGNCTVGFDTARIVTVNTAYWYAASENARLQLVYHELGHCLLNRAHVASYVAFPEGVVPTSVMSPHAFAEGSELDAFAAHRGYYEHELFTVSEPSL